MRNINLNNGNYNENIEGDYIQIKQTNYSVVTISENSDRYGARTSKKKIGGYLVIESLDRYGGYNRVIEGSGYKNSLSISRYNERSSSTTENSTPISPKLLDFINSQSCSNKVNVIKEVTQVVQGKGNVVRQNFNNNVNLAIGNMSSGHIGDDVTIAGKINQVVQGNNNKVSQSMLSNMNVHNDLVINEDLVKESKISTEMQEVADEINNIINNITKSQNQQNKDRKETNKTNTDIDSQVEDFWDEPTQKYSDKTLAALTSLAEYIDIKAVYAAEFKTPTAVLLAADEVVNIINEQPILKTEIDKDKNKVFDTLRLHCSAISNKLINIIEATV